MREWKKPSVTAVELSKTETGECECLHDSGMVATFSRKNDKENLHYCHRDNVWHQNNCPSLKEGHAQWAKCPTGGVHEWKGIAHASKCCCGSQDS